MPRPKPASPPVQFNAKLPPEEHAALGAIIDHWAADLTAQLAKQGVHLSPPADRTSWLRAKIRDDAARYGVPIASPIHDAPPTGTKPKAKPKARLR